MNYYIKGNPERAKEIKAAFEKLGCDTGNLGFTSSQLYYTIEGRVELMCTKSLQNLIKTHPDYKELELPKPHYDISNFKPKQWVLVRQGDGLAWRLDIFSHLKEGVVCQFECVGNSMVQCIPFEGNEHLLGTTRMPSEEYINW